jgi:hypothetical protein
MDTIAKQNIEPELLSEIKDEAAWDMQSAQAKKRLLKESKKEGVKE